MFEQSEQKVSGSANNFVEASNPRPVVDPGNDKKRVIIIIVGLVVILAFAGGFWFLWNKLKSKVVDVELVTENASSTDSGRLDGTHLEGVDGGEEVATSTDLISEIEYLSFANFYKKPTSTEREFKFVNYNLPMNVKVDVANYYDLSRKLNLEKGLSSINNNGFAVIDNPWAKEASNFYSLAASLDDKQIPLYVSADFISYYYQGILKSAFKEIEEGVFYESLWDINKTLYDTARSRYETHLAAIGNINDPILEGERLETAFFAVSLELLKPRLEQVDVENKFNAGKFSPQEQQKFSFSVPAYLSDDVLKELELIRAAIDLKKSPVLLYDRDYKAFSVPLEYKDNARLQNFYLAAAWLNSVFPLNYRDDSCPECLLDKDDWRINFTAACLIAQDFSGSQETKSEWARVYKTIAFFKGLRDTWNYVNYRDGLKQLFGDEYNIVDLFAESNLEAGANMEKLRQQLLQRQVLEMQGGQAIKSMEGFKSAGLQFLADFYWPNDFIFSRLRYPEVGIYQGGDKIGAGNVTACSSQKKFQRCQGSGQDVLSLIYPSWQGASFVENSNYANYSESLKQLRPLAEEAMVNNLNNYWSSLSLWHYYMNAPAEHLPAYMQSGAWREQMANSALGAWTDMQLPPDKFSLRSQDAQKVSLSSSANVPDYAWVEPNLDFLDQLIAHNQMLLGMFQALGINERSSLATNHLRDAGMQLSGLRVIAEKQARGESLNTDDNQFIRDFARAYSVQQVGDKTIAWRNTALKANIKEILGAPKLLIIAHPAGDKTVFAVGPVFNYQESR